MTGLRFSDHDETSQIPGIPTGTETSVYQPPAMWDDVAISSPGAFSIGTITLPSLSFAGVTINTWFDDWYNRIHLMPKEINLSNVVTDQTRSILLWNAYLVPKELIDTDFPIVEGVTIDSPVTPPYSIKALDTLTYTVVVSADGPPNITVELTWEIDGEDDLTTLITGRRIVVWPFTPDWSTPYVESLDWLTNVITSYK